MPIEPSLLSTANNRFSMVEQYLVVPHPSSVYVHKNGFLQLTKLWLVLELGEEQMGFRNSPAPVIANVAVNRLWLLHPFRSSTSLAPRGAIVALGSVSKYLGTWSMFIMLHGLIRCSLIRVCASWMNFRHTSLASAGSVRVVVCRHDTRLNRFLNFASQPEEALKLGGGDPDEPVAARLRLILRAWS
jgi:hypothetical protein